jgi:hypothetical protein
VDINCKKKKLGRDGLCLEWLWDAEWVDLEDVRLLKLVLLLM